MKIRLIPERCIACGLCQTYSDAFDYDDEGIVLFANTPDLEGLFPEDDNLRLASKSCPTKAILLEKE